MDYLPLFARLRDLPCLVVGGGTVAARKIRLLLRAGAKITVVAPEPNAAVQQLAADNPINLRIERFRAEHLDTALLVIAATADNAVNQQVAAAATSRQVLCNVVDDRELSTAILPAIIDRSPLLIAVSTGGRSPVLATQVRQRIETLLPANYGQLADWADSWRDKVRQRFTASQDRLRFWQQTLAGTIARRVINHDRAGADFEMQQSLAQPKFSAGVAWLVGAGPGDPELLTLKALRCIQQADVVIHDRLITQDILDFARKDAELISVGKQAGRDGITQAEINALLLEQVGAGRRVCRLKGGDPFIFGRGGEELAALVEAGLAWEVVPGITAAAGCAAAAGIPLTHRNVARSVTFVTGQNAAGEDPNWSSLAGADQTVVMYMSLARLADCCAQLIAAGRPADCPVVVIENGTTPQQRNLRSTLIGLPDKLAQWAVKSPALLIVGDVAAWAKTTAEGATETAASPWLAAAESRTNLPVP